MNRVTALFALIALAGAGMSVASADDTVYVSERNGTAYHGADCPRLRFATPMPLSEASQSYRQCPVCEGRPGPAAPDTAFDRAVPVAAPVDPPASAPVTAPVTAPVDPPTSITLPEVAAIPPAPAHPVAVRSATTHRRGGKARWILAAVGGFVGFGSGVGIALSECLFGCENEGRYNIILGTLTIAGALGGYALGGGFSQQEESVDQALERDRAAIRTARADPGTAEEPRDRSARLAE